MPAAATLIRTSPAPGIGTAMRSGTSTSGGPGRSMRMKAISEGTALIAASSSPRPADGGTPGAEWPDTAEIEQPEDERQRGSLPAIAWLGWSRRVADGLSILVTLLVTAEAVGDLVPGGRRVVEVLLSGLAAAQGGAELAVERLPVGGRAADPQIGQHGGRVDRLLERRQIILQVGPVPAGLQ